MPINVVCSGCKKRFSVNEKFAGQQGPCPNCKAVITIPALEDQVVVHAPDTAGAVKDSEGKAVIAPVLREEARFSAKIAVGIVVGIIVVFVLAAIMGRSSAEGVPIVLQGLAALALAPMIVYGGYSFLRNDELEPYSGSELWLRVIACAVAYAFLWGAYAWVQWVLEIDISVTQLVFVVPPVVLVGGFAAFASLDLDYTSGLIHYSLYLIVTVLLRVTAGMGPF